MKLNLIIEKSLSTISRRIEEAPKQKLAELAANNVSRSTFAVTNTFGILTDEIKKEISSFIDDLSKTKIRKKDVEQLRVSFGQFITNEYEKHKQYLIEIRIYQIGNTDFNGFIQSEIDESLSVIEIKLMILDKKLADERYKLFWDIGKIIFSAIIGGVLGRYLK